MLFAWELLARAWRSVVQAMGTTTLTLVVVSILIPGVPLALELWKGGLAGVREHWRRNLLNASATLVIWGALFLYHLAYVVPQNIRSEAVQAVAPLRSYALGVPLFWADKSRQRNAPVEIGPAEVTFGTIPSGAPDALSEKYTFRIRSKTLRDLYAVSFMLVVDSDQETIDDFRFDIPKSSQKPVDENDPIGSKFGDIAGSDCTDSHKRPVFYRSIYHLGPLETREITLLRANPGVDSLNNGLPPKLTVPKGVRTTVRALITHFSTKAEPLLIRGNLTAVPLYVSEILNCSRASFAILK